MCRLILIFFLFCVISAAILLAYTPWYVSLGVLIGGPFFFYLFLKIFGRALFKNVMLAPFKIKSAVLRGATLEVHEVLLAPRAVRADDQEAAKLRWYSFDVTVTPSSNPPPGKFQHWEPGEIILVEKPMPANQIPEDAQSVDELDIFQEGQFVKEEGLKYDGTQRIRFTAGVKPEWKKVQVYYYFERLSEIELPR